jgi:hypothetical protein
MIGKRLSRHRAPKEAMEVASLKVHLGSAEKGKTGRQLVALQVNFPIVVVLVAAAVPPPGAGVRAVRSPREVEVEVVVEVGTQAKAHKLLILILLDVLWRVILLMTVKILRIWMNMMTQLI